MNWASRFQNPSIDPFLLGRTSLGEWVKVIVFNQEPTESAPSAPAGLRVLELGTMVAASFCCKLLASLGADVVKVEHRKVGDSSRRRGPFPSDDPHPERRGHSYT